METSRALAPTSLVTSYRRLFALHSLLGLSAGMLLLAISLAGVATVFRNELNWVTVPVSRAGHGVAQPGGATGGRVPPEHALRAVAAAQPDLLVKEVRVPRVGFLAYPVAVERTREAAAKELGCAVEQVVTEGPRSQTKGFAYVDPASGAYQGARFGLTPGGLVQAFHTNLTLNLLQGGWGPWGRVLVGSFGLALLTLSVTGFLIYRNRWKTLARVRMNRGSRIFFTDAHKVLGIWTIAFNLMIGATATTWGLEPIKKMFAPGGRRAQGEQAAGALGEKAGGARPGRKEREVTAGEIERRNGELKAALATAGISSAAALQAAQAQLPGFRLDRVQVTAPSSKGGREANAAGQETSGTAAGFKLIGRMDGTVLGQQHGEIEVQWAEGQGGVAAGSGAPQVGRVKDDRSNPLGTRLYEFMEPLHFGTMGEGQGLGAEYFVKLLWALLGLSPSLLSISGSILYMKRQQQQSQVGAGSAAEAAVSE